MDIRRAAVLIALVVGLAACESGPVPYDTVHERMRVDPDRSRGLLPTDKGTQADCSRSFNTLPGSI